jgi:hypothetical protein
MLKSGEFGLEVFICPNFDTKAFNFNTKAYTKFKSKPPALLHANHLCVTVVLVPSPASFARYRHHTACISGFHSSSTPPVRSALGVELR